MLLSVSRPALKQGTAAVTDGEAATGVVYGVPLTGAKAPHAMGGGDVAKWGQLDAPSDATAVFPADSVPSSHDGADLTGGGLHARRRCTTSTPPAVQSTRRSPASTSPPPSTTGSATPSVN